MCLFALKKRLLIELRFWTRIQLRCKGWILPGTSQLHNLELEIKHTICVLFKAARVGLMKTSTAVLGNNTCSTVFEPWTKHAQVPENIFKNGGKPFLHLISGKLFVLENWLHWWHHDFTDLFLVEGLLGLERKNTSACSCSAICFLYPLSRKRTQSIHKRSFVKCNVYR